MEFQAPTSPSFIPKRPSSFGSGSPSAGVGIFMFVGVILFLASAIAYGGVLIYRGSLEGEIVAAQAQLAKAQKTFTQFGTDALGEIVRFNLKLKTAQQLLNGHVSLLHLFDDLEALTYQTVRFNSMKYVTAEDGIISLKLSGQAKSYTDFNNYVPVALQSGRFATMDVNFKNVVFSDLNLDQTGNVVFNVSATIGPKFVSYRENHPYLNSQ